MTRGKEPIDVQVTDDWGDEHHYHVIPHGAGEGWPLGLRILEIVGQVVGAGIGQVTPGKTLEAQTAIKTAIIDVVAGENVSSVEDFRDMTLEGIDITRILGAAGVGVGSLAGRLIADPSLLSRLLKFTLRDGKDLSNQATFNAAFQANYGELMAVIVLVVRANFGPLFRRRLGGLLKSTPSA